MHWDAIVFDLGGVVLESPLHEIARFEREAGVAPGSVNRVVHERGAGGAWARHERGELSRAEFLSAFQLEFEEAGVALDARELLDRVDGSIAPRPVMVRALRTLADGPWKLAAITNNWIPFGADGLPAYFDVFVESVVEGVRKPEPEIYRRCLDRLDVDATRCIMLDDIGTNLKAPRAMGMHTIKVITPDQALAELSDVLGVDLSRA